jgi:acyl carrier protein phosphodiesterase
VKLPVGRWFKIRTHFIRSVAPTTVRVWFDDALALEWVGAINSVPSNKLVEYYVKLYGGVQRENPWTPTPTIRYSRNVKVWK